MSHWKRVKEDKILRWGRTLPSCEEQEKDAETVEILSQEFKKVRCTEKDN